MDDSSPGPNSVAGPADASAPDRTTSTSTTPTSTAPLWRSALVMVAKLIIAAVAVVLVVRVARQVDWAEVAQALGRLTWWELAVIVLAVGIRQVANAYPLVHLIPGLSVRHAVPTGLAGTLIQTFMPPPSDTVLRLSMLRSFGHDPARSAAGLVLDTVVFYLCRFTAPIIGLLVALATASVEPVFWWMTLLGVGGLALFIGTLVGISKGEKAAATVGHRAGSVAARVRRTIRPGQWAAAMVRFQRETADGLWRRMGRAWPAMFAFVVIDGLVLVLCLRFVGIPYSQAALLTVLAGFFCFYPLTVFPFAGLGVLDASLIALINVEGFIEPADLVAALVIWRAATLILPLLPGLVSFLWWRGTQGGRSVAEVEASTEAELRDEVGPL